VHGPVGFVGPLAVILPWVTAIEWQARRDPSASVGRQMLTAIRAGFGSVAFIRPVILTLAMLAVAAPWYVAVGLRTNGEWPAGFFLIHNVGRFAAPMENHSGGIFFHLLAMLVGFYPWSCFLPFAIVVATWRATRTDASPLERRGLGLALLWLLVWVGAFSLAATKLPNYVLPAYPAAALVVAATATRLVNRESVAMPRWLAAGLGWVVFGGVATVATILVVGRFGVAGATPAALVGLVPILGAARDVGHLHPAHRGRAAACEARRRAAAVLLHEMALIAERELGREQEAIDLYRRALEQDPLHVSSARALSGLLEARGQWAELAKLAAAELASSEHP
jgi:4-amino-4-deoxy-L-arabinose transferase-like glycosyltransferase